MQSLNIVIPILAACISVVLAQNGPAPPRLAIPGAIAIPIRSQFRNDKLVRIRRPQVGGRPAAPLNAIPIPIAPRLLEEAKPVIEEPEEEVPENFIPQFNAPQQISQPSALPQLEPNPNGLHESSVEEHRYQPQERPLPPAPLSSAQRFAPIVPERKVVRRPAHREPRPQFDQEAVQTIRQTPVRRPALQADEEDYRRKPVAQILRKYREEHEDGSITWGFENDDGSFKEETIGNDCVTRGRYGYIDPDGVKREYNYETGILCDPNKRDEPELEQTGFVDYEGNKAILPNGVEVDLSAMGRKKSKRPGAFIPQQPQPQPIYRN